MTGPLDLQTHDVAMVSARELDRFGGMAAGAPRLATVLVSGLGTEPRTRSLETRANFNEVHKASSAELDVYYSRDVREHLRAKYFSTAKPGPPVACGCGPTYVAVHVRRGDVRADSWQERFTGNELLEGVIARLAVLYHPLPIIIFSQGVAADFASLVAAAPAADVRLCLNAEVRATFHALVSATALVVAKSSFSYSAALLSRGIVYADVIQRWWHRPLSCWELLLAPKLSCWL